MGARAILGSGFSTRVLVSFTGRKRPMNIALNLAPVMALIAGILIAPRLLSTIVAIYLIAIGLTGIFGLARLHL